jgi:hypothetical protein
MAEPKGPDGAHQSTAQNIAHDVFSSEKREDIWALLIAAGIFLVSVIAPGPVHAFFSSVLVLF